MTAHHGEIVRFRASLPHLLPLLALVGLSAILMGPSGSTDAGDDRIRWTIRLALCFYALAVSLMLTLRETDWRAASRRGRVARWSWTCACATYIVHVALAFHYYHQWSHAHAVEHTRSETGLGEGIFVSYLFTLLWTADAALWWLKPAAYANRSLIYDRLLHGFMLFMIFNATVIYEDGLIRWAGVATFCWLGAWWYCWRWRK